MSMSLTETSPSLDVSYPEFILQWNFSMQIPKVYSTATWRMVNIYPPVEKRWWLSVEVIQAQIALAHLLGMVAPAL
jgi:hypothetical protein